VGKERGDTAAYAGKCQGKNGENYLPTTQDYVSQGWV
jgi:hypothetical protein